VRYVHVGTQQLDFAEFYRTVKDERLVTVLVSVGDQDTAPELVAEAFARAWASWERVDRHPAPAAWVVRTALNVRISRWRRRRREVPVPDPGAPHGPARGQHHGRGARYRPWHRPGSPRPRRGRVAPGPHPRTAEGGPVTNDDELMTLVRAQRDQVPMTVPLEDIVRRGRAVRTRRLVPGAAGGAGRRDRVGLAVSALLPAGHQASHQPPARPAAWTVTRLSGGDVSVTFNQFGNLAGLQHRLRADGYRPASPLSAGRIRPAGPTPGAGSGPGVTRLRPC